MSRDQLQQVGAVLASHVDMIKGFLGDQFAVSIIARHKGGPFHLLLGDDAELTLIACLSELQRIGVALIKDGEAVTEAEPTVADHMFNLLQETAEQLLPMDAEWAVDLRGRIEQVLAMCPPQAGQDRSNQPTLDAYEDQLTVTQPDPGRHLEPPIGDMADAPAVDGRPE